MKKEFDLPHIKRTIEEQRDRMKQLIKREMYCDKCQEKVTPVVINNELWVCPKGHRL